MANYQDQCVISPADLNHAYYISCVYEVMYFAKISVNQFWLILKELRLTFSWNEGTFTRYAFYHEFSLRCKGDHFYKTKKRINCETFIII